MRTGITFGLSTLVVVTAACASAPGGGAAPAVQPQPAASAPVAKAPAPTPAPAVSAPAAPTEPAAPAAPAGPVTTLAGVYSAAQARRGDAVFQKSCLECHVPTDYTGDSFRSKFVGGTAYDMYEQIRSSMPQSDPGSLTSQQYTDLVAFLFSLNGLPTRSADLPPVVDSLKAIKVQAKAPQIHSTHGARIHHGSSHIR